MTAGAWGASHPDAPYQVSRLLLPRSFFNTL